MPGPFCCHMRCMLPDPLWGTFCPDARLVQVVSGIEHSGISCFLLKDDMSSRLDACASSKGELRNSRHELV